MTPAQRERREQTLEGIQARHDAPPPAGATLAVGESGPKDEPFPLAGLSSSELASALGERREALTAHPAGSIPASIIAVAVDRLEAEQMRRLERGPA